MAKQDNTGSGQVPTPSPKKNRMQVLRDETRNALQAVKANNITDPDQAASMVIDQVATAFAIMNAGQLDKNLRWKVPAVLEPFQVAEIIVAMHNIRRVSCFGEAAEQDTDLLAVYQEDGPEKGIYSTSENGLKRLMNMYNPGINIQQMREVEEKIALMVPRVPRCSEPNLVPVNNGIFDFDTKTLLPFSPDYVFLSKCRVDYVPTAVSPVIHNRKDNTDWELEAWMKDLSDDPEITNSLWEIIGACIRPNVAWNKAAWFYSEVGNNGKGTLCHLMRNLCGNGNHTAIPLADFGKDFSLEPLIRVSAIINDENDVDIYIDRAANLKAVITGDVVQVNRKFKQAVAYRFRGFMVQCINSMPKVKDKSDSFYRRQLIIPFHKNFSGMERRYIKEDYLSREDVLQYALHRVLHMDYYELSEPAAAKAMLDEYKEYNDPIRQFLTEFEDQFVWDLLPYTFLHDLYMAWMKRTQPDGKPMGKTKFTNALMYAASNNPIWAVPPRDKTSNRPPLIKTGSLMDKTEMLIKCYALENWTDTAYKGLDENKKYSPRKAISYRGLVRKSAVQQYGIKPTGEEAGWQNPQAGGTPAPQEPEPGM